MFTTSNNGGGSTSTIATSTAAASSSSLARSASRGSPYSNSYGAYSGTNVNPAAAAAAMHPQNATGYQDYSSMYPTMDMAWHAAASAAYSATLPYRGYDPASIAEGHMWPPQTHPHMNTFIPSNSEVEPSLALSHDNFLASNISTSTTTNTRPGSPPEYKMFNNNESRDQEVKTAVRPSPDSGLAISEAMSNSGSPGAGAGPPGLPHPPPLQPQGSPIPGSNLVVRPQPARSPYEWMRKGPSNTMQNRPKEGNQASSRSSSLVGSPFEGPKSRTRTKDKYRVVYSDHQRLELEKEFHYSRYITIRRKAELAQALNLSERQVKIWFQNRRAKERKQMKKRDELIHKEKLEVAATLQAAASAASNVHHHPFSFHHPAVMSHLP